MYRGSETFKGLVHVGKRAPHGFRNSSDDEPLCCCQYRDLNGELNHILTCCCDCEALDRAFDSCIRCERVSPVLVQKTLDLFEDRLRIPMVGGAVKVQWDVIAPAVFVPAFLCLGALHPLLTAGVLTALPGCLYVCYRVWRRRQQRRRTQLFYSWGLTSVVQAYLTFEVFVVSFREILLWENLLLTTIVIAMLIALFQAKKGPGVVRSSATKTPNPPKCCNDEHCAEELNPIGKALLNIGFSEDLLQEAIADRKQQMKQDSYVIPPQCVDWVDSRINRDGYVSKWCDKCELFKPARTAHCPVCDVCVPKRDHHCVWIDCCIGAGNQRAFIIAVILYILAGAYGCHLTLCTICTPAMYFDWILLPDDCSDMYSDYLSALCFVTSLYAALSVAFMCLSVASQCLLISQNLTGNELHAAAVQGYTKCLGFWATHNVNNRGFLRNWQSFWCGKTTESPFYPGTLDEAKHKSSV